MKRVLPVPSTYTEILKGLLPDMTGSPEDGVHTFIEKHMRPLKVNEKPSFRKEVQKKCLEVLGGTVSAAEIQVLLRGRLLAPEKQWQGRVDGVQSSKVQAYRYNDGRTVASWATLKE